MPRVSYYTGKYASLIDGIREDIYSRILTLSGERWWRSRYGTALITFLSGNITQSSLDELRSEILFALAPVKDKYRVTQIGFEVTGGVVEVFITVIPTASQEAVHVKVELKE